MDREELIRTLDKNFMLAYWQEENGGRSYKLCLRASWTFSGLDVRGIQVQLVGTNPLTGEDVAAENIAVTFSFDRKEYRSQRLLNYHGKFVLRCVATMGSGEKVQFRDQDIMLECEQNKPEIVYTVRETQGFRLIEIKSNCWSNCKGKLWITVDGHEQRVDIPAGRDKMVRFYMSASGRMDGIRVQNDDVIIRQEG
jgi:hypothetical protein